MNNMVLSNVTNYVMLKVLPKLANRVNLEGPGDVIGGVDDVVNFIWDIIATVQHIMIPVAIAAMVFCGAMWVFSSDQQTVMQAKKWMFRIVLGLVIIWIGPGVVQELIKTLGGKVS